MPAVCGAIMSAVPLMWTHEDSMAIWPQRPIADRQTFRTCCSLPEWERGPCRLWPWSPRSCMEPHTASLTPQGSPSRMEGRTDIPSQCRSGFMTKRYESWSLPSGTRNWDARRNWVRWRASMSRPGYSSTMFPVLR